MTRTRLGHPERLWIALAAAVVLLLVLPAAGRAITVQTFPVPSGAANLSDIVAGPDGALWFTEKGANKVGRITTAGQITEYPIPNLASGLSDTGPTQIVSSGGTLWFLTDIGESVYRMATSGAFTRVFDDSFYDAANLAPSDTGGVWLMQLGGDGNPQDGGALIRIDPNGAATPYPATHPNHFYSIAEAPDGSVWFNNGGSYLVRVTDAGAQVSFPLSLPPPNEVSSIAFAPNGTPWFTDYAPNSLMSDGCCGGVDELVGGVSQRTPIGVQQVVEGLEPDSLTLGPDGALWFAFAKPPPFPQQMNSSDGIGRIDPATGQVQLVDTDPIAPGSIAFGSDGALWFIDNGANAIGRIPISPSLFPTGGTGGGPGPGQAPTPGPMPRPAPKITLTLPAATVASLRRTGMLRIGCRLAGAGRCSVNATLTAKEAGELGLGPARHAKTVQLAHGSAVLHHGGHVTITLHLARHVLGLLAHVHQRITVTVTGVSSVAGTRSRAVKRSLLLRP